MENIYLLQECELFRGLAGNEFEKLYECLSARQILLTRGMYVFHAGDKVESVYLILSGSMHILDEDFWGNRSLIETMNKNVLFGEAYVLSGAERHLTSVIAAEDSVLLEINPELLFKTCPHCCNCHIQLNQNALRILSNKIVRLTEKLGHISRRSMRERLLSYLSHCARQAQCPKFDIPYSRQQLADYLCVDRSSLSHELAKLQREEILRYHKNSFELLD